MSFFVGHFATFRVNLQRGLIHSLECIIGQNIVLFILGYGISILMDTPGRPNLDL